MPDWQEQLEQATEAWRQWCQSLERVGTAALEKTITTDEIDLAEGLRYMARMSRLALMGATENVDSQRPYFWTALDPHSKMGGDNPQGLYLSAPINPVDTFVVHGTRGSARWFSAILGRSSAASLAGQFPFGNALFAPDLQVQRDGTFEIVISPDKHSGNWIESDQWTSSLLLRQFFGTPDDVRLMDLTIENVTAEHRPPDQLELATSVDTLSEAMARFTRMVPYMQSEMIAKGAKKNLFATDIGDPTSESGGVPGGNAVTARWSLEPDQALLVKVTPPQPCAYWDVQVGNGWYESFDYRHHFSGLTCEGAESAPDGSVTLVLSERDPGTANWLETAHHREGHIAIRWQLTEGRLPIPECTVIDVDSVQDVTGLRPVSPIEREEQRRQLVNSFDRRFCR